MTAAEWKRKLQRAVEHIRAFARQAARTPSSRTREPRLGLALGGGFARGLAHIGVLNVLEENGIRIHCLAGTSVGSIIAGAYASGATMEEMAAVARKVRWNDFARWTLSRMGLATNHRMEAFVKRAFRALHFEDLKIPLAVAATDLASAQGVIFTSGELALAVRASCAYPGLFLPVAYNGSWLVDGMLVAAVPTKAAKELGANVVVAVLLDNIEPGLEPRNMLDVLSRSFSIAQRTAEPVWRAHADIVVEPDVRAYRWDEFEHADELIAAGEKAMREALPRLRPLLEPALAPRAAAL
ncbi:MAG: patatin-like phospholipase family protein [Terriglobia bacterium]